MHDLLGLFGTVPNAYKRLGFREGAISLSTFYSAVKGQNITEFVRDMVQERWAVWQQAYTKSARQVTHDSDPWSIDDDYFFAHSTVSQTALEAEARRLDQRRAKLQLQEAAFDDMRQRLNHTRTADDFDDDQSSV